MAMNNPQFIDDLKMIFPFIDDYPDDL